MTATAPDAGRSASAPEVAVVVCDEQLLFGEAFAETLRMSGVAVVTTTDPLHAVQIAVRGDASTVVINPEPNPAAAASALREIRKARPGIRLICLGKGSGGFPGGRFEQYADLALSRRRPLQELVDAVLQVRRRPDPARSVRAEIGRRRGETARPDLPLAARFLSGRERQVLQMLAVALPTKEIARRLGVTIPTARGYIQSLFGKLGVHSRVEAVTYAVRHALVEI